MQPFILFIVIIATFACQHRQSDPGEPSAKEKTYSEADARKFFEDSIAGPDFGEFTIDKFSRFLRRFYPELKSTTRDAIIYAMEEPFIDTTQIDTAKQWFRVTVDPCFRKPYCMVVERKGGKSSLTIKATNGFGCQYPGVLTSTTKYRFVGELYDTVQTDLKSLNFWALGDDTACHRGLDGEEWLIEAVDNGKYNAVYWWAPQYCGDSTTRRLANMIKHLAIESKLDAILRAIGAPKSGL
jgi:hypothetical protein